jgi:hypothetical protein
MGDYKRAFSEGMEDGRRAYQESYTARMRALKEGWLGKHWDSMTPEEQQWTSLDSIRALLTRILVLSVISVVLGFCGFLFWLLYKVVCWLI